MRTTIIECIFGILLIIGAAKGLIAADAFPSLFYTVAHFLCLLVGCALTYLGIEHYKDSKMDK